MPSIHVCSLPRLASTVRRAEASHLVTLVDAGTPVPRPLSIIASRHLLLNVHDVTAPSPDVVAPATDHVERLIAFFRAWDRASPLVIHCFAGISRSTAAAFIALCALAPERSEAEIAGRIRRASPTAFPNPLLVRLADDLLRRNGRMLDALATMGAPIETFEARPFVLPLAD